MVLLKMNQIPAKNQRIATELYGFDGFHPFFARLSS